MGYKNWKKNYHSKRKGDNWANQGFADWWDFEKDWKNVVNEGARRYSWRKKSEVKDMSFVDYMFRVKDSHPLMNRPIVSLTLEEVSELTQYYGKVERKKRLSAGGYRNGRKTYFKKVYNHRRRKIGKQYCYMVVRGLIDEGDSLDQGKDRHFGWDID